MPYKGFKRRTNHLRQGIKYNELSAEEKDQLEQVWEYETTLNEIDDEDYSPDIANYELFKYIFNEDAVDKVLQELMSSGLKVQSGELIGKTIIFAYNHKHAALLVERFEKLYPQYGTQFCSLIDYSVNYAQSLIDSFEVREKLPQIAVSVDMLDTGIDVPDILNLVFFKEVKSKIKFIQIVGRGTRLSPDIFGKGRDKKEFYIFDYCGNFEFFEVNPHGSDVKPIPTLTSRLFGLKAEIAFELQSTQYQQDEYAKSLHDQIKAELQKQLHLQAPSEDSHVRAIADGRIAYLRRQPTARPTNQATLKAHPLYHPQQGWTDNGCIVIKHQTEISENITITFYSIYMHLDSIENGLAQGNNVHRKTKLGSAGQIYGQNNLIHFEIISADDQIQNIIGEKMLNRGGANYHTNRQGHITSYINGHGRTASCFGSMYFYLPAQTHTYTANHNMDRYTYTVTGNTLGQAIYVEMKYHSGNCTFTTYDEEGMQIGQSITTNGNSQRGSVHEYNLFAQSSQICSAVPTAGYKLLCFGRVLGTEALNPTNTAHYRQIAYGEWQYMGQLRYRRY